MSAELPGQAVDRLPHLGNGVMHRFAGYIERIACLPGCLSLRFLGFCRYRWCTWGFWQLGRHSSG